MSRCQHENTYSNIKSRVTTLEPSGSTAIRTENLNAEEAENNDLKNNIMKMIEAIKEKMKKIPSRN